MRRTFTLVVLGSLLAALSAPAADARVVRIVVERTTPYAGGQAFGDAGAFERLDGAVYMEVDPDDPLNAVVVNLDRAPRNERGLVEFSAPFFIVKPVDMARGNRKLLYGINNRGNAIELGFHTFPPTGPDADDGLFFRLGYTLVDAGWAGDVVTTETRLGGQPAGRDAGRRQPHRLAHPHRVSVRPDATARGRRRRPYAAPQGERPLRELRDG